MVARRKNYWIFFILASLPQLGASQDDSVSKQLPEYAKKHTKRPPLTSDGGHPVDSLTSVLSLGKYGPVILDTIFFENMAKLNRERIPERVVHGRGSGAFGYFEVTHDITKYTKAKLFETVGKKTPIAVRFSMASSEHGTPETGREIRGMACKFYTCEGIWDLVGNNFPVFFFRDPILTTDYAHCLKRNSRTNIKDNEVFWDFFTLRPEAIHTLLFYFGDRGIPDGYRHMDGFGINTFMLVNDKNEISYAKFTYKTDQGVRNLSIQKALNLSAVDPDYSTRDLYNAIENKQYPSWTLYMQVMKAEDATKYRWNPFDPTKVWFHEDYPLIPIGKMVLNRNPVNYFAEVEQIAFCPSNFVPGIAASLDKVLQGRIFAYADAQRYRLGTNYLQLPVNFPKQGMEVHNVNRDGSMVYFNQGDAPNYYPNSYNGPYTVASAALPEYNVSGTVKRWDLGDDDNYSQPRIFWNKILKQDEKERIMDNIVQYAKPTKHSTQVKVVQLFRPLDEQFGQDLVQKLNLDPAVLKPK